MAVLVKTELLVLCGCFFKQHCLICVGWSIISTQLGSLKGKVVLYCIFLCCVQAWQSTAHSLLEVSVIHIVMTTMSSNSTVTTLGVPTLLLIAGVVRDRWYQVCNKLYFVFTLLISSWTDKKQRRGSTAVTLFLSLLFFPVVFAVIAAAAALSAPLLPLFTLPVFFIAFPRPQRFWPEAVGASANVCADTVYYRQLAPMLAQSLRKGFSSGSLGECSLFVCWLVA